MTFLALAFFPKKSSEIQILLTTFRTIKTTQEHIIKHLFSFFEFLSEKSTSKLTKHTNFKSISEQNSSWPNFIFDVDLNEKSLTKMTSGISKQQLPNHIILDETQIEQHEDLLTEKGFIPLAEWACLEFDKTTTDNQKQHLLAIKKITLEDLKEWINIASSGFGVLDYNLFSTCFESNKIEFYSGYYQDKMVATALLFYHNNTAGIYHVVTLPEFRSKGFGTEIFSFCEQEALKNGAERIIAQSTQEGLNAWKSTGMKQYGNFYLFCSNKLRP